MLSREEYLKIPLEERFIKLSPEEDERANRLFDELLTVDMHTHVFGSVEFYYNYDLIRQSGIKCCFEAVPSVTEDFEESMALLGRYKSLVAQEPGLVSATRVDEVRAAADARKQAVMYQLEPQTIGRKPERLEIAYGLGVRMMLLTFNFKNYLGDGCGETTDGGLSYLGFEVVERMNELGMLIDLSHCGIQTSLDAIKTSKYPVMINHTGAQVLYPQCKRLKPDNVLNAVADNGGVVGVSAVPNQLSPNEDQGIEDMLNHIDYLVKLIGADHVAIGLDNHFQDQAARHRRQTKARTVAFQRLGIELVANFMYGIESPLEWRNIVRGLVARGYSDDQIGKIVGANALRVMEQVLK